MSFQVQARDNRSGHLLRTLVPMPAPAAAATHVYEERPERDTSHDGAQDAASHRTARRKGHTPGDGRTSAVAPGDARAKPVATRWTAGTSARRGAEPPGLRPDPPLRS